MEKEKITITCKYCGAHVVAKSKKRKFCSDSHKGRYSVESKRYWIINKPYYKREFLRENYLKKNKYENIQGALDDIENSWEVMEMSANKKIEFDGKVILFFSKHLFKDGVIKY